MAADTGETIDISALPGMVRWYSPSHLISTGWRSIVSELFGQYADQRIMQATIDGFANAVDLSVQAGDLRATGRLDTGSPHPARAQRPTSRATSDATTATSLPATQVQG